MEMETGLGSGTPLYSSSDMENTEKDKLNVLKKASRICGIISIVLVLLILLLLTIVLIRALTVSEMFHRMKLSDDQVTLLNPDNVTRAEWADKLAGAISYPTVSRNKTDQNYEELLNLHRFLRTKFPNVFNNRLVRVDEVNTYSLLVRVEGKKDTGNPYLLSCHLDVVPAGNLEWWDLDPWDTGVTTQEGVEYIYGRGAVDMKHAVIGILQALDIILTNGGQPERTLYVALSHDEEVQGESGAKEISKVLEKEMDTNREQIDFMLDEGMMVLQDVVPGIPDLVSYIGVVEKGWAMIELSVNGTQTHSSTPSRESPIGILARAVAKLEENPLSARFTEQPVYDSIAYLAPYATFFYKMLFSNMWLFSSIISSSLSKNPGSDATQRTTTAVTIFKAGVKDNVIPGFASATVNHRIHPSEDLETVLEHDRRVIDDERVSVKILDQRPPPKVSPYSNDAVPFQVIANSALQVFPTSHVTPGILVGNTDSKHYLGLTDNIYRFSPTLMTPEDLPRFHGFNERISVDNFVQVVEFYYRVIKNADTQVKSHNEVKKIEQSG